MNCNGCNPAMINGVLCHETGCPDAWRDAIRGCKVCGATFRPEEKGQVFCSGHCAAVYWGDYCDCDECLTQHPNH